MIAAVVLVALAAVAWYFLFYPRAPEGLNFWWLMAASVGVLASCALALDRGRLAAAYRFRPVYLVVGLLSALQLYVIFFLGKLIAEHLFPLAGERITAIYEVQSEASPALIGVLLLLWIGPAEEVFWRGFVQRRLAERSSPLVGWLAASAIYALVHAWSLNLLLVAAAALCGLYWGAMYWRYHSVWPGLISHALWDLLIFVVLPLS